MQVVVSPEDDAEIRLISLENLGVSPRDIDVTSYAEIVLTQAAADAAHPAFSNFFIETEIVVGDGDKAADLIAILNPINHSRTAADVDRYFVEPYIAVGDIYSVAPHVGRGGWSWYTGTAGWLYRAGTEWLLGMRVRGTRLSINPCIPSGWPGFKMTLRFH